MKPIPASLKLNLNARSELSLRSGDSVLVTVIKRLTGNKWAVGIRGRVLPAFSEVELTPGQRLRALVGIRHGRITLKISGQATDAIQDLIVRQGLQPSQLVESIVTAFLRSALAIVPDRLDQVRQLLERLRLDPKKFARIVPSFLKKGSTCGPGGLNSCSSFSATGNRSRRESRADGDAGLRIPNSWPSS